MDKIRSYYRHYQWISCTFYSKIWIGKEDIDSKAYCNEGPR
ncbi:hypothetical protein MHC_06007 [Mycoplasma haemocanis str. Illinois]|uniref:Uncharacterized protein n=1 Tax=Mycoplasma haemocanis (strain Illinois) TaxID=1111676 RepID=I6RHS6_MYCHN|nr:hypothetical protein MHC_06007 [Mycoplasma haemocanis str. Illinois]